eukprot:XP_012822368.1 PREDICTED: uncharacterized protein C15orf39 homolog isoform X1 [Xenopus tropicalis]
MSRKHLQSFLDITTQNKAEMGPQSNPSSCPQKSSTEEFFTYKSYMNYSMPAPSAHNSASPWRSATAYLQYAGSALNQHLRADRVPGICHRNEVERTILRTGSQLLESTENHFQVQQHNPGLSYPLTHQGCPSFAMPRPVYRSPTSYLEGAYDTLALPFGIQPGFQQIPSPAVERNPRFAYPSSPVHLSSTKNNHYSGPLEMGSNSHCFPQGLQDQSQPYKQRHYASSALQMPCSQGEILKDCYPSFNHNVQMNYNQADVSGELQRNPEITPSHQHQTYKSSAFYSNTGEVYSMSHHLIRDIYGHRPNPFGSSIDTARLPHSVKGMAMFNDRGLRMNVEHNKIEESLNKNFKGGEQQMQVESECCKNLDTVGKDLQYDMGKLDRDRRYGTSQEDNIPTVGPSYPDRGIEQVASLKESLMQKAIQSSHRSIHPQIQNLHPMSAQSTDVQESGEENSKVLSSRYKTTGGLSDKKLDLNLAKECAQKSNLNDEIQSQAFQATSLTVTSESQTAEVPNPQHPEPTSVSPSPKLLIGSEVDENDGRSSPPMPVINDVFSLAPYREYLEGTAPHPFPTQQENRGSKLTMPHSSPQLNRPRDFEKSTSPILESVHNPPNADFCSPKNKCDITNQVTDCKKVFDPTAEEMVLDLSFKKSLDSESSPQGPNTAYNSVDRSPLKRADSIVSKISAGSTMASMDWSMQATASSTSPKSNDSCFLQETGATNSSQVTAESTSLLPHTSCSSQASAGSNRLSSTRGFSQATKGSPHPKFGINCSSPVAAESTPFMSSASEVSLGSNPIMSSMVCNSQITGSSPLITSMSSSSKVASESTGQLTTVNCFSQNSAGSTHLLSSMGKSFPARESLMSSTSRSTQVAAGSTPFLSSTSQELLGSNPIMSSLSCNSQVTGSTSLITSMNSSSQAKTGCATEVANLSSSTYTTVQSTPIMNSKCFSSEATSMSSPESNSPCFPKANQTLNICSTLNILLPVSPCYDFTKTPVPKFILPKNNTLTSPLASSEPSQNAEGRKRQHSDISQVPPTMLENETNSFHSSKSFMFKKYKMMKLPSTGGETQGEGCKSSSNTMPVPVHSPPEGAHSLPPSAPESSPTLGEANVSLASDGAPTLKGSRKHFTELHKRVCTAILNSVARSPLGLLQDLLAKSMEKERPKSSVKVKSSSRSCDSLKISQHHSLWLDIDGVRLALHKLLSLLETFMFTRRCPFPHVIRAGAIFIPIYLVKKILYSELSGTSIDRVLQSHKVELRPTTLSEEKALRETELKDCPSRMLKLLALKQLPDVYPDMVHLYWEDSLQKQIDKKLALDLGQEEVARIENTLGASLLEKGHLNEALEQKKSSSLVLRLQRVWNQSGADVYKAQRKHPSLDSKTDPSRKKQQVYGKKLGRKRGKGFYRKNMRSPCRGASKVFPDLVGRRILHLFDDGDREAWFPGRVVRVHRQTRRLLDTQFEVLYDEEPGTRYYLELLQDYEKGWLRLDN